MAKLVLPALLLLSVGIMIGGQVEKPMADRARMYVADALAPLWNLALIHIPEPTRPY